MTSFIGQDKIRNGLVLQIEAAKIRNMPVSHFLMFGPDNMGKTTLAKLTAGATGVNCQIFNSKEIRVGDLVTILMKPLQNDFLIFDKFELFPKDLVEILIAAMRDFALEVVIGKGPEAENATLHLSPFTIVGLSSQPRQINRELRDLFLHHYEFIPYSLIERSQLIDTFIKDNGQSIMTEAANLLANYCEGTINDIQSLSKKIADYCLVNFRSNQIEYRHTVAALEYLEYLDKSKTLTQITDILFKMTGIEFENFVANLFSKAGYSVETTKASGDHGIDLFLKRGNETIAVQCKRWDKPVGEPVIRDFYGALLNSGVRKGLIVTTATYTSQARSFKSGKPIDLIDMDRLLGFIKRYM